MDEAQILARFNWWQENTTDPELVIELNTFAQQVVAGQMEDVSDAFFQELTFGTAGLRGVIGVGTNRMNVYTVARATQGLANYLNAHFESPSVAVARDSRNKGEFFVQVVARVLAANDITAYLYPRIEPTPALSFAVRDLGCSAGINMTASHNPKEYNGYKVYGADGCQITSEAADEISAAINKLGYFGDAKMVDFDEAVNFGKIVWIDDATLNRFIDAVQAQSQTSDDVTDAPLKVVYTPLNGTGLECVSAILDCIGVEDIVVVPEQAQPDGNFPTCEYPNPETREALELGIELCKTEHPDLLLATDPDADRVGVACEDGNDYTLLTGNEMGVLLLDYVCRMREQRGEDLSRGVAVTTIVSSAMVDCLAMDYGFELRRTLTGFKYIGEQIALLEKDHEEDRFLFGFEESYGYLAGTHVRDKDAIVASMLICQMAQYYRAQGKTLVDAMRDLYEKHGYWLNKTISLSYPGADGANRMADIMSMLREGDIKMIGVSIVDSVIDYRDGVDGLPPANVIEFRLTGGSKVIVRPSGTEPKIKVYIFANEITCAGAKKMLSHLESAMRDLLA